MRDRIIEHFKLKYSSSPVNVSEAQIELLITRGCRCDNCGKDIFELYDFPNICLDENEVLCEECYDELYYQRCGLCDNSFDKPETPEATRFIVSKELSSEAGLSPGIYQALSFPMYYGDCVTGFDAFFEGSIKLVRSLDINSIQRVIYGKRTEDITLDEICPDCYDLLTNHKYIRNNYCDKTYGLHQTINIRGALQRGF